MAAHQAPPSLGLSRQEHWSGLPFPSPMHESESEVAQSCLTQRSQGLQPTRLLCPRDFPGKNAGVGCHCLLPLQIKRNTCVKNHSVVPHFHSNKWTQIKKKKKMSTHLFWVLFSSFTNSKSQNLTDLSAPPVTKPR